MVGRLNSHGLETKMKFEQTNLSRLKACEKLAGGKVASSRRSAAKVDAVKVGQGQFKRNFDKIVGDQPEYAAPTEL